MPIRKRIEQGESTLSLSDSYGFFAKTIWNHSENKALREKREDMNILMPGDVLFIPDKEIKELEKPSGQKHTFRRKGIPAIFRIQLFMGEVPRANQQYKLTVDGTDYYGTTSDRGILTKFISPHAQAGELVIGPDALHLEFQLGYLDPVMEITGVQKRLNNLGYDCGEPDGTLNSATSSALRRFQQRFGLPVTGNLTPGADDPVRKKLRELHDSTEFFPEPQEANVKS